MHTGSPLQACKIGGDCVVMTPSQCGIATPLLTAFHIGKPNTTTGRVKKARTGPLIVTPAAEVVMRAMRIQVAGGRAAGVSAAAGSVTCSPAAAVTGAWLTAAALPFRLACPLPSALPFAT